MQKSGGTAFLLLDKIDKLPKDKLLPIIEHYSKLHNFQEIIPISAIKHDGLDVLVDKIMRTLPEGPRYFPTDQLTDLPERFIAAEIIREKVLLKTGKEIPYATAVVVERFEDLPKLTRIAAAIYCERGWTKGDPHRQRRTEAEGTGNIGSHRDGSAFGQEGLSGAFVKVRKRLARIPQPFRGRA